MKLGYQFRIPGGGIVALRTRTHLSEETGLAICMRACLKTSSAHQSYGVLWKHTYRYRYTRMPATHTILFIGDSAFLQMFSLSNADL